MSVLTIERLAGTVGAEIVDADPERMASDDSYAAAIVDALEANGVLVFRELDLDPESQIAFCRRVGEIDTSYEGGVTEVPGVIKISLDPAVNSRAEILKATFDWHIDGCIPMNDECPQMATVLTAAAVAAQGGDTEFANTYAGYEALSDDEKERFGAMRVVHSLEASQRTLYPDPSEEQLARWRSRPPSVHPLVWTHRSGRKSLVLGNTASHIEGMDEDEGHALLLDLLARTTVRENVYRHHWTVGDTVIWDNRGVLHRVTPYTADSRREMLRTTILGDEPIE
jgi:alpha-ketoglutarate-dependent taurine dioxygenase